MEESDYIKWAKEIIDLALKCVEDCPSAFEVVAFQVILEDLVQYVDVTKKED